MTITLELNPEELTVLNYRAQAQGTDIQAVLHDLVAQIVPAPAPPEKPELNEKQKGLVALIDAWRKEDETDNPEELDRRDRDLEEFMTNINRWRAEEGRPPAY
ncbi:MAG: hypothetical protein M3Y56_02685 [Armatimonadota bacterium]|nr:hypothetical protein [Armatimonadota bacterium]